MTRALFAVTVSILLTGNSGAAQAATDFTGHLTHMHVVRADEHLVQLKGGENHAETIVLSRNDRALNLPAALHVGDEITITYTIEIHKSSQKAGEMPPNPSLNKKAPETRPGTQDDRAFYNAKTEDQSAPHS